MGKSKFAKWPLYAQIIITIIVVAVIIAASCFLMRNIVHEYIADGSRNAADYTGGIVARVALVLCITGLVFAAALVVALKGIDAVKKRSASESRKKSIFMANMGHEMRTPLNAIISLSDLLLETDALSGENYAMLEKINDAGGTLLGTVNDIMDISRIEAGQFEINPVEYDVPGLINDSIAQNVLRIGEKNIKFALNINDDLPARLYGDDLLIKQMLNSLLSNAFKYTWEGQVELGVRCERNGDAVLLTAWVSDTGRGIRQENMANLFADYMQAGDGRNRKAERTGLGLFITKKVVEMMGGSVSAESEYGKGSVFTLRIPQRFVSDKVIGQAVMHSLKVCQYSDYKHQRKSGKTSISVPYARVLAVDEVATNLDVVRGMLKPYGIQVDYANSGQEAVDAVRTELVRYNAIFMDHMMSGMDGIKSAGLIRELGTDYAQTVPIIAFTVDAAADNEQMFLDSGFQAFIPIPAEMEQLDAVVTEWIQDKDLEEKLGKASTAGNEARDNRSGSDRRMSPNRRHQIDRRTLHGDIADLDMEKGFVRFGSNINTYMQVLRSYVVNTSVLLEKARAVTPETMADYAITVHGIKGSSRGIFAESIGKRAEALEVAAKEGNYGFILNNNDAFITVTTRLIRAIDEKLKSLEDKDPKPVKDKPDAAALKKLSEACKIYSMDKVDEAMEEINAYQYDSDQGLALWIRENVEQMNFDLIVAKVAEVIND